MAKRNERGKQKLEVSRTEIALAAALKELLTKEPLSKISVKDLTEKCQINRKTYYYHFKDKYDLVQWIFMEEFYKNLDYQAIVTIWDFIVPLSEYFYQNKAYYANAFLEKGQNSFSEFFSGLVQPMLKQHFQDVFSGNEFHDLYADYAADGAVLIFEHWLKSQDQISPQMFIKIMKNAIYGFAEHVLSDDHQTFSFEGQMPQPEQN